MSDPIDEFDGQYHFLSNFFIHHEGLIYKKKRWKTAEHAFQAAKTHDQIQKRQIIEAPTPDRAKKLGRKCKIRFDWDDIKDAIMLDIIRAKFQHPQLRQLLLDTGDAELIEGNTWGDRYWGVYKGKGENKLGQILMRVRQEIGDTNDEAKTD